MPKSFSERLEALFEKFRAMKPGEAMEVAVVGKRDPQLFIDCGKMFIDDGNYDFEFSNDYKYFKRINKFS